MSEFTQEITPSLGTITEDIDHDFQKPELLKNDEIFMFNYMIILDEEG